MENDALNLVASELPDSIQDEYLSLFEEFQEMKTAEAKVAREADKLETLLQGNMYEIETGRTDILNEFLRTYSGIFKTKTGKLIFESIKLEHAKRLHT
jgi:5'-deoxynucleotidase YfbR-like HD superfamily hydrolase